jgi:hypothetical protein
MFMNVRIVEGIDERICVYKCENAGFLALSNECSMEIRNLDKFWGSSSKLRNGQLLLVIGKESYAKESYREL